MTEIKLYNTKTRKKEVFAPIDADDVRMYVCGPTVYDRAHIGNARPVIVFDVLYRLLREVYGVDHVQYARNFTDVDDKINATAAARKEAGAAGTLEELIQQRTDETIAWYLEDMGALGNLEPDHAPRATEYIAEMVEMSERLIASGHAYAAEGHVLFDVTSYDDYGSLSGRSVDDMIAGARVEVAPYKRNPMDFVLWKPSDADQPGWDSTWGRGRPGWHIECSAMAEKLFGKRFDIHGGGLDLAFPHHENEKAQSCACGSEDDFAQVWMHNEMLQVEGKKMSKSLGNFFSVRELLDKGYSGEVIRFVFLSTHYRKPMDWTDKKAKEARRTLAKWRTLTAGVRLGKKSKTPDSVVSAVANDLNTHEVLLEMHKLYQDGDAQGLLLAGKLVGLLTEEIGDWFEFGRDGAYSHPIIDQIVLARFDARTNGNFELADKIRSELASLGISIMDYEGKYAVQQNYSFLVRHQVSEIHQSFEAGDNVHAKELAEKARRFGIAIHVEEDGPSAYEEPTDDGKWLKQFEIEAVNLAKTFGVKL